MFAVIDSNGAAARWQGKRGDECNNQIVVDYVLGGERALDNMARGGGGRRNTKGWWTTRGDLAASNARQSGGGQPTWDNMTVSSWKMTPNMVLP
jgi:hypothetical protein